MRSFFAPIIASLSDTTTRLLIGLSSISALCVQLAPIVSVLAGLLAIGYGIYKWRRDARERTCDTAGCPMRHRSGD